MQGLHVSEEGASEDDLVRVDRVEEEVQVPLGEAELAERHFGEHLYRVRPDGGPALLVDAVNPVHLRALGLGTGG